MRNDILVVDDNDVCCDILVRGLQRGGFGVDQACCGAQALELTRNNRYSLILLDVQLPCMSGLEVLCQIRRELVNRDTAIVLVSGSFDQQLILEGIVAGAQGFLAKPVRLSELRAAAALFAGQPSVGVA